MRILIVLAAVMLSSALVVPTASLAAPQLTQIG